MKQPKQIRIDTQAGSYSKGEDAEVARQERQQYGVCSEDVWGFDSYLLRVFANGLQMLAEQEHSADEEWVASLFVQAANARWLVETYDEREDAIYDKYEPDRHEKAEAWLEYIAQHGKTPPEALSEKDRAAQLAEIKALWVERDRRKDELLDFIKVNFNRLWD